MTERLRRWKLLAEAGCLAVGVRVALRAVPLPVLARWLGIRLIDDPEHLPGVPTHDFLPAVRATDRVFSHWPSSGTCLQRSLVLGALLKQHDPVLQIGAARRGAEVHAHAWIEIDGAKVAERASGLEFRPLRRPSAAVREPR